MHTTIILVLGVIAIIIAVAIAFIVTNFQPATEVRLGSGVFKARLADNEDAIVKGLSGTAALHPNEAMLFIFDEEAEWGIWMKDMLFPIDIVWLDNNKEVVYIVKNASPEFPEKTFTPTEPARYVVELEAGATAKHGIKIGEQADFVVSHNGE